MSAGESTPPRPYEELATFLTLVDQYQSTVRARRICLRAKRICRHFLCVKDDSEYFVCTLILDVFRHQLPEEVTRYYLRQGGVECQDDTTCVPCHRSFRADQAESENAPIKPIKRTHDIECPLDDDRRLLPAPLRRPPRPAPAA